tara:strand:+ start:44544 stop:45926 length:1383 start_codon:yes stop_codon:yes gene_type:complete
MKKMALHWKILIGLVLGIVWSFFSASFHLSQFTLDWLAPFGTIFVKLLKLIAVPLVLFSIITGVAGLSNTARLGRLGLKTIVTYILTTILAVTIGLLVVNSIAPGKLMDEKQRKENRIKYEHWAMATPDVSVKGECISCNSTVKTSVENNGEIDSKVADKISQASKTKEQGPLQMLVDIVPSNIFAALTSGKMMLQVIFFALFFGIALVSLPKNISSPLIPVLEAVNEVFLKMVDIIMKASPFFVFALLAGEMAKIAGDDISKINETFKGLSWYSLTVVIGLAIMIFVVYPLLVKLITRKIGYAEFFRAIAPAQLLAFSSSSSAATLPVTLECVEENLKVSKEISGFVLPVGATVNMDGTSLYQAVAVVFLAQMHMVDLSIVEQISIVFTATMASIGAAAVPGAGLIMLIIVLQSVGLNPVWISVILPVDRILDMCRTVVNVTGDATVATIIAKSEGQLR